MSNKQLIPLPAQEVATHESGDLFQPAMSMQAAVARYKSFAGFVQQILHDGIDYGTIPGSAKPALLKPGAEKLCTFFGLRPEYEHLKEIEEWTADEPFFYYLIKARSFKNDRRAGEGEGSCNSRESKYRGRWVEEHDIPAGMDKASLKSRDSVRSEFQFAIQKGETTGHFGKPAAYWEEFRQAIEDGRARKTTKTTKKGKKCPAWEIGGIAYRVPNPDICDLVNTILKIAQKRALIFAVLVATAASEFFTQDLDGVLDEREDGLVGRSPEAPEPADEAPENAAAAAQTNGFDFGLMIREFGKLRQRLAALAGDERAESQYYRILAEHDVQHSNQFKSAQAAKAAYKALAALEATLQNQAWQDAELEQETEAEAAAPAEEADSPEKGQAEASAPAEEAAAPDAPAANEAQDDDEDIPF